MQLLVQTYRIFRLFSRKRHGFLSPDTVFIRMTGPDAGKFV